MILHINHDSMYDNPHPEAVSVGPVLCLVAVRGGEAVQVVVVVVVVGLRGDEGCGCWRLVSAADGGGLGHTVPHRGSLGHAIPYWGGLGHSVAARRGPGEQPL